MRFSEDSLESLVCADGAERPVHVWQPDAPRGVLVAVHGGMAHGGDFVTPALYFKARGWATVALDQRGHDRREKVFIASFDDFLDDLELFVGWVKERHPGLPLILLGHSMGGLILTHYGLRRMPAEDPLVRGFVLSSPYYRNAIRVSKVLLALSGVLSAVVPRMAVPVEDFTDVLTHDPEITARHRADAADHLRATEVSARFARELLDAQDFVPGNIARWRFPLLAIVAGDDRLADCRETERLLGRIDQRLVTTHLFPGNFHENFNELGREEIFGLVERWIEERVRAGGGA